MILALLLWIGWLDWLRPTNTHTATAKGVSAFERKKYPDAVKSFDEAQKLHPSPAAAYNLGTAQIAAGQTEQGSATLARALEDPRLRADALYNRGTSALAAKSYDYAIRDLSEALRLRPADPRAKRNLEIAIQRRAMQPPSSNGNRGPNEGQQSQPSQKPQGGDKTKPDAQQGGGSGQKDTDAMLRAVQQQEKEELSRMRKQKQEERKLGW